MIIVKRGMQAHRDGPHRLGNVVVQFERLVVNGSLTVAAHIPDDHKQAASIRASAQKHPNYKVMPRGTTYVREADVPPPETEAEKAANQHAKVLGMAKANGWADVDLEGVGLEGKLGPAGGTSATTGLSLADMAAIRSPENWSEKRDEAWPWELADWKPPVASWSPPHRSPKSTPEGDDKAPEDVELDADDDTPPEAGTVDDPEALEAAKAAGEITELPPGDDGEPKPETEVPAPAGEPAEDDDPAVVAGYPAEHVAEARAMAHALAAKKGSTDYHHNALNYVLNKAELPTVNPDTLAGLLAVTPSP